jgi:hypothetical protein
MRIPADPGANRTLTIIDRQGLESFAMFDPAYLHFER